MKKFFLILTAVLFTLLFTGCSDSNKTAPASEVQKLAQKGTTGSGPFALGSLERENYNRQTDPTNVVFHGEMVMLTDNNHLIPVQLCGAEGIILADMLDDDGLYRDFQFALTQIAHNKPVMVTLVIEDNTFYKDKFVITHFDFPFIPDTNVHVSQPTIVDTVQPVVKPQPSPVKVVKKNKDCGCCPNTIVNATNIATLNVNNGVVTIDSTKAK